MAMMQAPAEVRNFRKPAGRAGHRTARVVLWAGEEVASMSVWAASGRRSAHKHYSVARGLSARPWAVEQIAALERKGFEQC